MKSISDRRLETLGKQMAAWSKSCTPFAVQNQELRVSHVSTFLKGFAGKITSCPNNGAMVAVLLLRELVSTMEAGLTHSGMKVPEKQNYLQEKEAKPS